MTRSDARRVESEGLPWISINELNKRGLLKGNSSFKMTTTWGNYRSEELSAELFIYGTPRLTVRYFNALKEEIYQTIWLDKTPCYFGGYRWWFKCPTCPRRAGKLYKRQDYRCIECNQLTYKSRLVNPHAYLSALFQALNYEDRANELLEGMRSPFYAGYLTKRAQKIVRLRKLALLTMGDKYDDA